MKKSVLVIFSILVIILGILYGMLVYKIINNKSANIEKQDITIAEDNVNDECTEFAEKYELGILENTMQINSNEQKVSPNATIIIKTFYKDCGHTIKDYEEVSKELVNLTLEDFAKKYKDYQVQSFTNNEIVVYKELEGSCDEHYMLREKDGNIAIYHINKDGKEELMEITDISTQYLTDTDLLKIKQGLKANGKENLNSILEDFE